MSKTIFTLVSFFSFFLWIWTIPQKNSLKQNEGEHEFFQVKNISFPSDSEELFFEGFEDDKKKSEYKNLPVHLVNSHPEALIEESSPEELKEYIESAILSSKNIILCLNEENNWCGQYRDESSDDVEEGARYFNPERTLLHQRLEAELFFLDVVSEQSSEDLQSFAKNLLNKDLKDALLQASSIQNDNIPSYASSLLLKLDSSLDTKRQIIEAVRDIQGTPRYLVFQNIENSSQDPEETSNILEKSIGEIFKQEDRVITSQIFIQNLSMFSFREDQYLNLARHLCDIRTAKKKEADEIEEDHWKILEKQIHSQLNKKHIDTTEFDFSQICKS